MPVGINDTCQFVIHEYRHTYKTVCADQFLEFRWYQLPVLVAVTVVNADCLGFAGQVFEQVRLVKLDGKAAENRIIVSTDHRTCCQVTLFLVRAGKHNPVKSNSVMHALQADRQDVVSRLFVADRLFEFI